MNLELVCPHLLKRMYDECGSTKADEFIRRVEAGEHDVPSPWSGYTQFDTLDVQKRIRRWVESRLGMAAMDLHERGMRSGEEQIELGQCCGVTREEYHALVDHVYNKPVGDIRQELGGTALTLLACADGAGYVLSECAIRELERVESLPPEKFRKRQDENVANGIGAPPVSEGRCGSLSPKNGLRSNAACVRRKGHGGYHGTEQEIGTPKGGYFWLEERS